MDGCSDNEPIRFLMILFLSFFNRDYERCYQEGEEEGRMEGERTALWVTCSFGHRYTTNKLIRKCLSILINSVLHSVTTFFGNGLYLFINQSGIEQFSSKKHNWTLRWICSLCFKIRPESVKEKNVLVKFVGLNRWFAKQCLVPALQMCSKWIV